MVNKQPTFHRLSEFHLLLQFEKISLEELHAWYHHLENLKISGCIEVVPARTSITLHFETYFWDAQEIISALKTETIRKQSTLSQKSHTIPVCYEAGLDLDEISASVNLSKNELIKKHSMQEYTVAMTGFLPGFLYLDGLDSALHIPRKSTPRKSVPDGSVAVGGSQTGIYGLESPGGWHILGLTPIRIFDRDTLPPMKFLSGDKVRFSPISIQDYENGNWQI